MSGFTRTDAQTVLELFEKHWPHRRVYPGEFWCGTIATAIQVVSDRRPPMPPTEPSAVKYGRLFVMHADEMIRELRQELASYTQINARDDGSETLVIMDQTRFDSCQAALAAVEAAIPSVTTALAAWRERDPLLIRDRDPAKFLFERLQQAWISTGEKAPKSDNEDDPVCTFLADALALTSIRVGRGRTKGQAYTSAAISAVLSGQNKGLDFIRVTEGDNQR